MALVDSIPIKRFIPHEPGAWIEVRRLSWLMLKEARKEQAAAQREEMKALGAEFVAAILRGNRDEENRVKERLREQEWDVSQFDTLTLLRKGLAGWSYADIVDPDTIGLLDPVTAEWAAREILALSRPIGEVALKNGFATSIGS